MQTVPEPIDSPSPPVETRPLRPSVEANLQGLIPIAMVIVGGCEPCAEKMVTRALKQGSSWQDIDKTLRIAANMQRLDCFAGAVGADVVARMEKPLAAGRRTLQEAMAAAASDFAERPNQMEESMTNERSKSSADESTRKAALNKRLEDFGWGVLLVTIGTIWLLPQKQVPQGSWLIAAGLIMLGLNVIRYFKGIKMSDFSLIVGILALFAGLGEFFGLKLPFFPIALIVIGACMLLKRLIEKNSTFPTGQGWRCCGQGEQASNQESTRGQAVGR
jgi:hypothetical protein